MFKAIRNTHLLLGLFFSPFVLMYGVSSVRFAHREWVNTEPAETEITLHPESIDELTPRSLARALMDQEGVRGILGDIRETDDGFKFRVGRIGTQYEIQFAQASSEVTIKKRESNLMGMLLGMHVYSGVSTGYWLHDVWGWIVVLTSVALTGLGVTGIYLWFKIHRERIPGLIFLSAGLAYALTLIVLLRIA